MNQRDIVVFTVGWWSGIVAFMMGWWLGGRLHAVMLRIACNSGRNKIVKDMP